jgi:flagellar protein FlgJ
MIKSIGTGHSFSPPTQGSASTSRDTTRLQPRRQIDSNGTSASKVLPHIDRSQVNPEVRRAAEGMEAMFLDYMFKVMRETVPKNDLDLESPATQIYRGMMDTEYADKISHQGGIGLADQIIAYLSPQSYHGPQGPAVSHEVKPGPEKEKP